MRFLAGPDQRGLGGNDVSLVLVPDWQRERDGDELVRSERRVCEVFLHRPGRVEIGEDRRDLGELQVVLGFLDAVAGRQDVGVVLQDEGADRIVVVVGDEPVDRPEISESGSWGKPRVATRVFQS